MQDTGFHFLGGYAPFCCLEIDFPPFGLPQFARPNKDQGGNAQCVLLTAHMEPFRDRLNGATR